MKDYHQEVNHFHATLKIFCHLCLSQRLSVLALRYLAMTLRSFITSTNLIIQKSISLDKSLKPHPRVLGDVQFHCLVCSNVTYLESACKAYSFDACYVIKSYFSFSILLSFEKGFALYILFTTISLFEKKNTTLRICVDRNLKPLFNQSLMSCVLWYNSHQDCPHSSFVHHFGRNGHRKIFIRYNVEGMDTWWRRVYVAFCHFWPFCKAI